MCSQRQRLHTSEQTANQCEAALEECEETAWMADLIEVRPAALGGVVHSSLTLVSKDLHRTVLGVSSSRVTPPMLCLPALSAGFF
jgi:hypothetical protein